MSEYLKKAELYEFKELEENGEKAFLNVNNSLFFEVDEIAQDILNFCNGQSDNAIVSSLNIKYRKEIITETIQELKKVGAIIPTDFVIPQFHPPQKQYITSLALHVCQGCNLRCKYCYEGKGTYSGNQEYMSEGIAQKAIDFLLKASGPIQRCRVIFFGGEPLLNFNLIKYIIEYCKKEFTKYKKKVTFTITTNGTLLTDKIIQYLNENKVSVMLSLDGPKDVHDKMRVFANGKGSYEAILPKAIKLLKSRGGKLPVRATVTSYNPRLSKIFSSLKGIGFNSVYLAPVSGGCEKDYAITEANLFGLKREYKKMAEYVLGKILNREDAGFSLFAEIMHSIFTGGKRVYSCGSGRSYLSVDPKGDLYLCQRFVGMKDYKMGNITDGLDENARRKVLNNYVNNREDCKNCWARYFCGGGCYHDAVMANGNINKPDIEKCKLSREIVKLAFYIYRKVYKKDKEILDSLYSPNQTRKQVNRKTRIKAYASL